MIMARFLTLCDTLVKNSLKIERIISKCLMTECHDWMEECHWFCDSVVGLVSEQFLRIFNFFVKCPFCHLN